MRYPTRRRLLLATAGLLIACTALIAAPIELQGGESDIGQIPASPLRGSWAGRAPGTYVQYRRRMPERARMTWVPIGDTGQYARVPSTEPVPAVEDSLLRLTLVGRDAGGNAVVVRESTTQVTAATQPDASSNHIFWEREPAPTREIGYASFTDPRIRVVALRRDTITLPAHAPIDCIVRTYELRNRATHLLQEVWTLAETDDLRDGSQPDALILRVRHVEVQHVDEHRLEVVLEPTSIDVEPFDGQPITTYAIRCDAREILPDGKWNRFPTEVEVYSPDVPAYFVRSIGPAAQGALGRWIDAIGVDASHLQGIRQLTPGEPARLAAERADTDFQARTAHRRANETLAGAIHGNADGAGPDVLEALDAIVSLDTADAAFGDARQDWSQTDASLNAILAHPVTPEVGRKASIVAARRGLRIEPALLPLCDADPEGLDAYVRAAALLETDESIPVLLRGVTANWSYIRAASADALSRRGEPAARDACERLAGDPDESVRAALLATPAERTAAEAEVVKARAERYALTFGGEWFAPFEPPHGKPTRAAARLDDYDDETWPDEPDDAVVRPTVADHAPGSPAFWRLPRIDVPPDPQPDEGQREQMQDMVVTRTANGDAIEREPTSRPTTRSTADEPGVRRLSTALIIRLSRDVKPSVRALAVAHLADRRAEPAASDRLLEMIDDPDVDVVTRAMAAIGASARDEGAAATRPAAKPTRDRLLAIAREDERSQIARAAFVASAALGDPRIIDPACRMIEAVHDPADPRVIGAVGALRCLAADPAALDALIRLTRDGPHADLAAHALATVRDDRAADALLTRYLAGLDALDAIVATQPATTRPTGPASIRMSVSRIGYAIDDRTPKLPEKRLVRSLTKAMIRSADVRTVARLREALTAAGPKRQEELALIFDEISRYRRGEFVVFE